MKNAIELIKRYEGLSLTAYQCPAGIWTIGWGHTRTVRQGDVITSEEAENLLRNDVAEISKQLDKWCGQYDVKLSGNQRSALISFIFNVGFGAFKHSTLWKLVRVNPCDAAISQQFARWKYADGKLMSGLMRRRRDEAMLYFK